MLHAINQWARAMDDVTEKLIAEYLDAFRAANTMSDPPAISYQRGWFTFKSPRMPETTYRRKQVVEMRDKLRQRAALTSPSREESK